MKTNQNYKKTVLFVITGHFDELQWIVNTFTVEI